MRIGNGGVGQLKTNSWSQALIISIIALVCGFCNYKHVSTMFENDRHFSHLSNLEREMTFRTEMALYYSYYKRIVQAPSFIAGLRDIMRDNLTEYPSTINTLQRFNLYPEVVLGAAYRSFISFTDSFGIATKECWQVDRGEGLPDVWSCEGLGDPTYFYVNGVWLCAGLTAGLLFIYGTLLSQSLLGGVITAASFFFNHGECTRVQWTPPLRESFAFPLILAQLLSVSWCLQRKANIHWIHLITVSVSTCASLITWQFSQFVFLTQTVALAILWLQNRSSRPAITVILLGNLVGLQNAVLLLFANEMLLTSLYACALVVALGCALFLPSFSARHENEAAKFLSVILHGLFMTASTLILRWTISALLGTKDDAHILNLLRSKLTSYRDFHTMMYTCAAEFDFMSTATLYRLTSTLLLPTVYAALVCVALYSAGLSSLMMDEKIPEPPNKPSKKTRREKNHKESEIVSNEPKICEQHQGVDSAVIYNVLQLVAFTLMASLIMRLKLFMSPHLCIIASLIASRKYIFFFKSRFVHWAIVGIVISGMSLSGWRNIMDQRSFIGEYSNPPLEELINWIQTETQRDAAFAGPMPVMASVLLTTQRPVVNHPHYESALLRERTKTVYRSFGRGTVSDLYRDLVDLKVSYLVIQDHWCYGEPRPGCSMLDIWDMEEPENMSQKPLCHILFGGNSSPLQRVFSNEVYVVLRVPSHYVELKLPPRQYSQ